MAEAKAQVKSTLEREYVIPLRHEWAKVPRYKRTAKSVRAIKEFIIRHMNVRDGDMSKVKLDVYLNNEVWFRGAKKPPAKIKVKATKEGEIVRVELVETPEVVKFLKARQEKRHKKVEKKKQEVKAGSDEKKEGLEDKVGSEEDVGRTEEEKKEESEKVKAVEDANIKIAEKAAKAQKHTVRGKEPITHRKALKK